MGSENNTIECESEYFLRRKCVGARMGGCGAWLATLERQNRTSLSSLVDYRAQTQPPIALVPSVESYDSAESVLQSRTSSDFRPSRCC